MDFKFSIFTEVSFSKRRGPSELHSHSYLPKAPMPPMQDNLTVCPVGCNGECMNAIELIPHKDNTDAEFCNFVCQFMSQDCSPVVVCMEQPCANFLLCKNLAPQWVLDLNGGICQQPCALVYGCAFEFSDFGADDACPLCLETGLSSSVFQCEHMVCARCYGRAAFSEAAAETLKRCPMCRSSSQPRMRNMVDTSFFY